MTTLQHPTPAAPPPFAVYEDEPPTPSEDDFSFHSDIILPGQSSNHSSDNYEEPRAIEEPRPYTASYTTRPSILTSSLSRSRRRQSAGGVTSTSFISSLPSETSFPVELDANNGTIKYTPRKERPLFRNPASVRAMQMSSPPPFAPTFNSPHEERHRKGQYKLSTPTASEKSRRSLGSHRGSRRRDDSKTTPTPVPQTNLPLVLLHVTILPTPQSAPPCSPDLMTRTMPDWLVQNYKLLEDKLNDVVLMRRGLLIPHPGEEYDLLEERILESLELQEPRLSKCGHFCPPDSHPESEDESEDGSEFEEDEEQDHHPHEGHEDGRDTSLSGNTLPVPSPSPSACDQDECTDCHRPIRRPGKGVGAGKKRWDVKIYAANGLMRAGAWAAAWREMERCDVEIAPWVAPDLKLEIEKKVADVQEAERQKMLYDEELRRLAEQEKKDKEREVMEREMRARAEREERERKEIEEQLWGKIEAERERKREEDERLKEELERELQGKMEEVKEAMRVEFETQAMLESEVVTERFRALEEKLKTAMPEDPPVVAIDKDTCGESPSPSRSVPRSRRRNAEQIPLGTALKNYLLLLASDQRNLAIVVLGALVAYLAMHANVGEQMGVRPLPTLPAIMVEELISVPISSVVITDTATLTMTELATKTEVATTTVTQEVYHTIEVERPVIQTAEAVVVGDEIDSRETLTSLETEQAAGSTRADEVEPGVIGEEVNTEKGSTSTDGETPQVEHSAVTAPESTPISASSGIDEVPEPQAKEDLPSADVQSEAAGLHIHQQPDSAVTASSEEPTSSNKSHPLNIFEISNTATCGTETFNEEYMTGELEETDVCPNNRFSF